MTRHIIPALTFFLAFCLSALNLPALAGEPVKACYEDKGWDNNVLGDSPAIPEPPGILIELLRELASRNDMALNLVRRPWKRCLLMAKTNRVHAVIAASYLPERDVYLEYPMRADSKPDHARALHYSNYYLFTKHKSSLHWDGETLTGQKQPLGVDLGYSIGRVLRNKGHNIREFADIELGLTLVQRGNLDGYVTFLSDIEKALEKRDWSLRQFQPPIQSRAYYLAFSRAFYRQHPNRAEALWDDIPALRRQLLPKLQEKYRSTGGS